uniref:Peptidase_M24 domain-containing protein n=1 Tax=Heterorhabditis bacteriophora TaxID=37862 RepID=A0A1I7WY51_HETBA
MGPEYNCYASDITTSFPANGKFTDKQKIIYNAVLDANRAVLKEAKPGVRWTDMHILSEKVILNHLKQAGIVVGVCSLLLFIIPIYAELIIGCLTSFYIAWFKKSVITIEPGCYFIDTLLDAAFANPVQAKFLVREEIDKYRGSGGVGFSILLVRIEDDVIIWANGNENMSDVPRTIEEIEQFMSSGNFSDTNGLQK